MGKKAVLSETEKKLHLTSLLLSKTCVVNSVSLARGSPEQDWLFNFLHFTVKTFEKQKKFSRIQTSVITYFSLQHLTST